jgi:3-hydroxyisobutyrate dehydrogenase-like beta-hydroxyacid dehydrogenase
MGFNMAGNVRRKMAPSSVLFIYDIHHPVCEKFVSKFSQSGPIEIARSVKEAAAKTKVLISSLPSTSDVRNVYLDETIGVIAAPADPDRLILECSTIASSSARTVAEELAAAKVGFYIDTPISVCSKEVFSPAIIMTNTGRSFGSSRREIIFYDRAY